MRASLGLPELARFLVLEFGKRRGNVTKWALILAIAIVIVGCRDARNAQRAGDAKSADAAPANVELSGGKWFNGREFAPKTLYSVGGILTSNRPGHVGSAVDLTGKFVVPPFADAHVHNLNEDSSIDEDVRTNLADGVFYAMEQDPAIEVSPVVRSRVNNPASVDVVYTEGLVTPSWGVMPDMYVMLAKMGRFGDRKNLTELDQREIFLINDKADLAKKWPALAKKNRDFIKVIVAFSEQEEKRKRNPHYGAKPPEYSAKPGIDPQVLGELVKRAHAAGLRVSAHIETAADFRLAVDSGVDIVAHLPASWQIGAKTGFTDGRLNHWELTDDDVRAAAGKKVTVITTAFKEASDPYAAKYRSVYRHNVALLVKYRVNLVIGTDSRGSVPEEILYLKSLDVLDNRVLLEMATRATPQAIFPKRKIGELRDGYEASFLALDRNPVENLENIKSIFRRFKQGHPISVETPNSGALK
jgi:hypothetical protein